MPFVHSAARWRRQPSQALGIDPSHPLAEECRFFVSFGALAAFDHVGGGLGTRNGSPTIEAYAGQARAGKINSGSSDYYEFAHRPDHEIVGDITLAWRGIIATGSAYRHFAGKHSGGGGTNCPFDFRTDNSAAPKASIVRSSGATFASFDSTGTIPLAVPTTVEMAKLSDLGATPSFYIGGADAGSTTSGVSGTATGSGATLRIGRRADGAVQQNGHTEYMVGWARRLTASELREFRAAPYALLRPVPARVYFLGAGGGGDLSVTVDSADLTLTGQSVAVAQSVGVTAATLGLAGQTVTLPRAVGVTAGTLGLTGQTIGVPISMGVTAAALALAGQGVTLTNTADTGVTVAVDAGTLTLTGQAIGVPLSMAVTRGTLTLAGQSVSLAVGGALTVPVTAGTLTLTGQPIGVTLSTAARPERITWSLKRRAVGFALARRTAACSLTRRTLTLAAS